MNYNCICKDCSDINKTVDMHIINGGVFHLKRQAVLLACLQKSNVKLSLLSIKVFYTYLGMWCSSKNYINQTPAQVKAASFFIMQ